MAEIRFKATRRMHDSGYRVLDKSGDLQYDQDPNSKDGVWIMVKGTKVFIDCEPDGTYRLVFPGVDAWIWKGSNDDNTA